MRGRFAVLSLLGVALVACAHTRPGPSTASGPAGSSGTPGAASASGVCPTGTVLDPGPDAQAGATAAATAAVPQRYNGPGFDTTGFQITKAYPADPATGFGAIAYTLCGTSVGSRTWVVELSFPKELPSQDLSSGQLFLARFPDGWKVWYQYH